MNLRTHAEATLRSFSWLTLYISTIQQIQLITHTLPQKSRWLSSISTIQTMQRTLSLFYSGSMRRLCTLKTNPELNKLQMLMPLTVQSLRMEQDQSKVRRGRMMTKKMMRRTQSTEWSQRNPQLSHQQRLKRYHLKSLRKRGNSSRKALKRKLRRNNKKKYPRSRRYLLKLQMNN